MDIKYFDKNELWNAKVCRYVKIWAIIYLTDPVFYAKISTIN